MDELRRTLEVPWVQTLVGCLLLLLVASLSAVLARLLLIRLMKPLTARTRWEGDEAMVRRGVFRQLARVVPVLVADYGLRLVPGVPESVERTVGALAGALVTLFIVLAASALLSAVDDMHKARMKELGRSITGYIQLLKIILFAIGTIIVIAILLDRSPMTLLAGLGAVSAVLLLVFKDTILSVVASVQLSSNDMLRVGDWIAMPESNVDGDVVEIALHTVKVENWDKTISSVPTWHLMSHSFRNYRHMYETGRRIRRAIHIDLSSVRFHTPEEIAHLRQFTLLDSYFEHKEKDVAEWNARLGDEGRAAINHRRLSNLGSFRAYMQAYVNAHPGINTKLFWAVRQLDSGPTGVPLQIYAYTVNTSFVPHENVQGDIFDHLITILPEFGLRLFQQPTGRDLQHGLEQVLGDAHATDRRPTSLRSKPPAPN